MTKHLRLPFHIVRGAWFSQMSQIPRLARVTTSSDSLSNVGSAISSLISPNPFKPSEGEEIICARFASKYTKFGQSLLLLGYQQGFQVWNVDLGSKHTKELVSVRTNTRVLAIEFLEYPEDIKGDMSKTKPEHVERVKSDQSHNSGKSDVSSKSEKAKKSVKLDGDKLRSIQDKVEEPTNEFESTRDIEPCIFILQSGSSSSAKISSLTGAIYSLMSGKVIKELKFDQKESDFELVRISKYFIAIVSFIN